MLTQALDFMQQTDRPHVHGEVRLKILSLVKEIDAVYKQHARKPTEKICDICSKGDTNDIHKVKDVVKGYEHREHASPWLCYGHASGWSISYMRFEDARKMRLLGLNKNTLEDKWESKRTVFSEPVLLDEEVDLHFAQYLAKQLHKRSVKK